MLFVCWLPFALAVFSWEPEPTASHLRFPWPPAAGWGSCHWVHCLKSVRIGNVKIMRRTLLSPNSDECRTKDGGRWARGGVALSSLLYLPPACLPAVVVALLADLLPVHSARVRPPPPVLPPVVLPWIWSEDLSEASSLVPQSQC